MDGQCTVIINGKTVGLKFNRYAIEQMAAVKGQKIELPKTVDEKVKISNANIIAMVWGGIQGYAFAKQIDVLVDFEEVSDWYEEAELKNDAVFNVITEAFTSSFIYKHLLLKQKPEEETKEAEEFTEEKKSNNLTTSGSYLQAS